MAGKPRPVSQIEDREIPGPDGKLLVRVYKPLGVGSFPTLMFFHGGGWVVGDLDTHDSLCRSFTSLAGCVTVAVDYRLAPEHKFPAAAEDCFLATQWVARNGAIIGCDTSRIAVSGDSAGGTLAAVVALMARDRGGPGLLFQLLICPVMQRGFDTPSWRENGERYLLTKADMEWYWEQYLSDEADGLHPYASPLHAEDLHGLPPALVITAEFDPLRDEGEAYARRLRGSGVPAGIVCYDGLIHSFAVMDGVLDRGKKAIEHTAAVLRDVFDRGSLPVLDSLEPNSR
jgi:acetyl esterase